jgi:hypothetical protein
MKINNILNLLNDGGSAEFASVVALVSQSMVKTDKESGEINSLWYAKEGITKRTTYQVTLNGIYTNMVNNQREREGKERDFKAKPNWFEPVFDSVNGSIVCNKNSKEDLYLKVAVRSAQTSEYFINGVQATTEQIEIIKKFKSNSKAKNQGLEKEITIRTIWLEGIEKINGKPV